MGHSPIHEIAVLSLSADPNPLSFSALKHLGYASNHRLIDRDQIALGQCVRLAYPNGEFNLLCVRIGGLKMPKPDQQRRASEGDENGSNR